MLFQRSIRPLAVLVTMAAADLGAQAVVKGHIRAAQTKAPLAMAEVLLENLGIRVWTNDSGFFRIPDIPLGTHQFRVRRVGFEGAVASLKVETADSLTLELDLTAWIPELETIYVKAPRRSRLVAELDDRRRLGFGRFVMPEELRENEHRLLLDLIRERGVEVIVEPRSNRAIAVGRASPTFQRPTTRCSMNLYLNGMPLPDNNLNLYRVTELDAIEIYRRPSETPVQYVPTGSFCGVILLWSRSF